MQRGGPTSRCNWLNGRRSAARLTARREVGRSSARKLVHPHGQQCAYGQVMTAAVPAVVNMGVFPSFCSPDLDSGRTRSRQSLPCGSPPATARTSLPAPPASYADLTPTTKWSGTSIHGGHRSRGCNRQLKSAMFLPAFAAARSRLQHLLRPMPSPQEDPYRGVSPPGPPPHQRAVRDAQRQHLLRSQNLTTRLTKDIEAPSQEG